MRRRPSAAFWILVVLLTVLVIVPLLWMVITSFKTIGESQADPPTLVPQDPTGRAYGEILTTGGQNPVLRCWSSWSRRWPGTPWPGWTSGSRTAFSP
jgi:multiple sugar transport system permease protein